MKANETMKPTSGWWLALSILALAVSPVAVALSQGTDWETCSHAGNKLREEGRYAEAEKAFLCAVAKAEELGPADLRLADSLANLAGVYREQSRYAEAVLLYRRALAIHGDTAEPKSP